MLKNMKAKALALLAALAMMLGLGAVAIAPAYADGNTGTLTVTSTNPEAEGNAVSAWRMFDITVSGEGDSAAYGYTLRSEWHDFFIGEGAKVTIPGITEQNLSEKAYEYVKGLTGDSSTNEAEGGDTYNSGDLADFAKKAADWAQDNSAKVESVKLSDASFSDSDGTYTATFNNVPYGYYVVRPEAGSTDVSKPIRGTDAMLVAVAQSDPVNVALKSVYPTVEKTVQNGEVPAGDHTSAQVGDKLTFTLTSKVPDVSEYDKYQFSFVDTLSKGLTFNNDVTVKIGTDGVVAGNYNVSTADGEDDAEVVTIKLGTESEGIYDAKKLFEGKAGQTITVTYTATVNSDAAVNGQNNPNSAHVEYSNNPGTNQTGKSEDDQTHQYTFGFDITKVDGADTTTKLPNAEFELQDASGAKIEVIAVTGAPVPTFRPKLGSETAAEADTIKTDNNGKLAFVGLKEGTYKLVETKAPDGYNKLTEPIEVVIAATYDSDEGTLTSWTASIKGTESPSGSTIQVENKKGTLLPDTGGMGTVLFTVAGVALIALGVVWSLKRSKSAGRRH